MKKLLLIVVLGLLLSGNVFAKTKNIGTEKHNRNNEITNASKYIKRPLFLSGLDHRLLERLAPEQTMLKL